jgi:hypothetical protein
MNCLTPPPAQLKKLPEYSQPVEQCGSFKKDLDVKSSGILHHPRVFKRLISDGADI